MRPSTVACFKWKPVPGYRSKFGPESVNVLRRMVARHYDQPHTFVCITDDPKGLDPEVTVIPLWTDFANLPSPHGRKNPSCYRRLRIFSAEIEAVLGHRFVCLDLDTVITGDLTALWDRSEDFVAYGETSPRSWYNGSMMLLTAGARQKVWTTFDPRSSPQRALAAGRFGSDQGWISHCLGKGEAIWTTKDGVYSYQVHLKHHGGTLPADARMVMWHGAIDPDSRTAQQLPWVREHYR